MLLWLSIIAFAAAPTEGAASTLEDARELLARGVTPRPAVPLTDPSRWIQGRDYPLQAARADIEGTTAFKLSIDRSGNVTACQITISSGSTILDDATCNLVTQRARFDPARDRSGKSIGDVYSSRVVWALSDKTDPPPQFEVKTSFVVDVDGAISDCKVDAPMLTETQRSAALKRCEEANFKPYTNEAGEPVRRRVRTALKVEVEPSD